MSRVSVLLIALMVALSPTSALAKEFKLALPGYKYNFPRDHASHDEFKTEWWYFTGHLNSDDKKEYGFELTFFRTGLDTQPSKKKSKWFLGNIYLAHFAVSDIGKKKFVYSQKLNRKGIDFADAKEDVPYVFNERWSMKFKDGKILLKANQKDYAIDLVLSPEKELVIHGADGISQKAEGRGRASHYYSFTRLNVKGTLSQAGEPQEVAGQAWMDHEFGSNQLTPSQVGWDWFSIQLSNNQEIMLYIMRKVDGSLDKYSSGTIVNKDGSVRHLRRDEFKIESARTWKSPKSGGVYPLEWNVKIPDRNIELNISPLMDDQELVTSETTGVTYWEGAAKVSGRCLNESVKGKAYVEMTGYAEKFRKRI